MFLFPLSAPIRAVDQAPTAKLSQNSASVRMRQGYMSVVGMWAKNVSDFNSPGENSHEAHYHVCVSIQAPCGVVVSSSRLFRLVWSHRPGNISCWSGHGLNEVLPSRSSWSHLNLSQTLYPTCMTVSCQLSSRCEINIKSFSWNNITCFGTFILQGIVS
jgi:hypothetical protein